MAKQRAPVEVTTFAKGLVTEVNPIAFPEDASIDEVNFILRRDGTRQRRLGLDLETAAVTHNSTVVPTADQRVVFHAFDWRNAGGLADKRIAVVQTGSVLKFFDSTKSPVSNNLLYTYNAGVSHNTFFSFATIDGKLVVVNGQKNILIFTYEGGVISVSTDILRTRDLFGVEDLKNGSGIDLTVGNNIFIRPDVYTDAHTYNLRNQSFGQKRTPWTGTAALTYDPIYYFTTLSGSLYPSNADAVFYNYYANPASADFIEKFHADGLIQAPPGNFAAPKGFFIIDAMERGASRLTEITALNMPAYPVSVLPQDKTPGGPSCVAEFAGRVWFGGFTSEVTGGDNKSPKLGSYVFFSRLVLSTPDITRCYQDGDPTSAENPDILSTDGGFIRISGANNILGMVPTATRIFVIAENGVWAIYGGETGFDATGYNVEKITENGAVGKNTIIEVDKGISYWGEAGIFIITGDEIQGFSAINVTQPLIQSYFESISAVEKRYCDAFYDPSDRKLNWLFGNLLDTTTPVRELVYDLNLSSFHPKSISTIASNRPMPVCYLPVPPFAIGTVSDNVIASSVQVVVGVDPVIVISDTFQEGFRQALYVTLVADTVLGELQYSFTSYSNRDFIDWVFFNSVGIDAAGYMVTGYITGGDVQRKKSLDYLTFHMLRTEDGFEDIGGTLYPLHPSSCRIQTQWEWTNSANANRWGTEFQAYRYNRLYMPADVNDPFDTGYRIITTRNKIRGHGRALSFKLSTEPLKDCRILGWAFIANVETNV